jgi:hypothetical protein
MEEKEKAFHSAEFDNRRLESYQRMLNKPRLTIGKELSLCPPSLPPLEKEGSPHK